MVDKIFIRDLECYKTADVKVREHPIMSPNRCFDLSKLPDTNIRVEMDEYIRHRGQILTPLSVQAELYPYNQLCGFLQDMYPDIQTFEAFNLTQGVRRCKAWLLKNGKNISQKRIKTATGKTEVTDSDVIKYLKKVVGYFNRKETAFDKDADVWNLDGIPIEIRRNPVQNVKTLNFSKIMQDVMKGEIKEIAYIHLSQKALGTVMSELTAMNRFSVWLRKRFPDIESMREIDREIMEEYLIYTNTEATGRKSYAKELHHLKSVLATAANVFEDEALGSLFYLDDIPGDPKRFYKVYSDAEIIRLNAAILNTDEQVARALILHQMLGTRISETLSLKQDAVRAGDTGRWVIRIDQVKTRRSYEKVISDEAKALFDKACSYTNERYGTREYVFVNDKDPNRAMQYSRVQYVLMAMITKNNLTDDNGKRFGVGTHIFRHCFGKKLAEMHVDDMTIAKLLGHKGIGSVKHYRKIGDEILSRETKDMRESMDEIIRDITSEWELPDMEGGDETHE